MDKLNAIQDDIYSKINKAQINYKKSPKSRITKSYVQTRLESLESWWSTFVQTHQKIISDVPSDDYENSKYVEDDTFELAEELYIDYKSELKETLEDLSPQTSSSNSGTDRVVSKVDRSCVKLPKIAIPIFTGKYTEWTTFHDLFVSLIHKNTSLDNVQKLHYLKSHLSGEADQLLRHIPITSDNYLTCWEQLTSRYSNKRYIANCILERFMSLKSIHFESSGALKELLDTTNETLNGLQNLGVKTENWDILVIYILSHKLDSESRKQWEDKISDVTKDLPTLTQFKEFLEHRFRALEFLDHKSTKHGYRNNNVNQPISKKTFHVNVTPCIYCSDSHKIANCKKFAKEDCQARRSFVQTRNLCFNCLGSNHSVVQCRLPTGCRICHKRHHSLLHLKYSPQSTDNLQATEDNVVAATTSTQDQSSTLVTTCFANIPTQVLLATALVKAQSRSGLDITLRSLLDQGSQASFVTESAVQLLGLKKYASKSAVSGLGSDKIMTSKHVVFLKIQSLHDPSFVVSVKAHVLNKLTAFLPEEKVEIQLLPQLPDIKLADPKYNIPNKIDILLGAEVYGQILLEGLIKGPVGSPVAQNTRLGWILSGKVQAKNSTSNDDHIINMHLQVSEDEILRKFWEIESEPCNQKPHLTDEEKACEEIFLTTTKRDSSGRYIVKLPLREESTCKDGNTQVIAAKRFNMLERKLLRNPELKIKYDQVILEYIQLGHMEYVPIEEQHKNDVVYLPHHAVIREDKSTTKLRVVFDASCPGKNGVSLNHDLMIGPALQDDLRHIIMRWRQHPVCLVADIVKMYRQIKVTSEDVDLQRLLWRDNPESEIKHLRLLRVTFGTASAPYLAVRTLQQLARDEGVDCPEASEIILNDFYMDDLMSGCETVEEGIKLSKDIAKILDKGGFQLQKWSSNKEEVLDEINKENGKEVENLQIKLDTVMKILGLTWNRCTDVFEYAITMTPLSSPVTKRKVISEVSRLFDPLGWLAPVIIKAKILIQALWISGIGWDDELPPQLLKDWIEYRNELPHLSKFKIPRWLDTKKNDELVEIHGFCDSSNDAYAAVVYLRIVDSEGNVKVNLVTSKTRVSPIKQLSIPKLELCGAVLLAKLLQEVAEVLKIPKENIHAWTDSSVVLAWLSDHPNKWKTFIANRVSEILTILERKQWSHVSTKNNPADCASRGMKPSELIDFELWRKGPSWLEDKVINYERKSFETKEEKKKPKLCHLVTDVDNNDLLWTKYSTLSHQIRVIAWIKRVFKKSKDTKLPSYLTSKELAEALITCIKHWQAQEFKEDLIKLKNGEQLNKKSKLTCLSPFLDEFGVLRVGGRLSGAAIDENRKHPIIIPAKTHFTNLLIKEAHARTLHGGPQLMVTHLRSRYWILDVKNQVKFFCRKCVICIRHSSRTTEQLMGQLPASRVTPGRPFRQSGVDYAGPINIRTSKGRGHHSYKGYICLFICMATRAIHLELVSDLTSQGFLAAFKRFVARRGHCSDLFSDNGTNFVGANRELKQLLAEEKSQVAVEIADWLANNGTTWHFIPPHAPNFGGLWEAGVKSTKHHLKRVIGVSTLTFEELYTVLSQIEACLNSRPLCQLSTESADPVPFTPGHFLIGEPPVLVPEASYENSSVSSLKRWQFTQRMVQEFWRKWSQEYLSQFLNRYRWSHCVPEPKIGDVVLVKEDDLPPSRWLYGIILQKHPGLDKITRVVSLRCKGVVIKRPVSKLCILPVAD